MEPNYVGSFLTVILIAAAPVAVLALFAWFLSSVARPYEDTAALIADERFANGQIDNEKLGVLLQAL